MLLRKNLPTRNNKVEACFIDRVVAVVVWEKQCVHAVFQVFAELWHKRTYGAFKLLLYLSWVCIYNIIPLWICVFSAISDDWGSVNGWFAAEHPCSGLLSFLPLSISSVRHPFHFFIYSALFVTHIIVNHTSPSPPSALVLPFLSVYFPSICVAE